MCSFTRTAHWSGVQMSLIHMSKWLRSSTVQCTEPLVHSSPQPYWAITDEIAEIHALYVSKTRLFQLLEPPISSAGGPEACKVAERISG